MQNKDERQDVVIRGRKPGHYSECAFEYRTVTFGNILRNDYFWRLLERDVLDNYYKERIRFRVWEQKGRVLGIESLEKDLYNSMFNFDKYSIYLSYLYNMKETIIVACFDLYLQKSIYYCNHYRDKWGDKGHSTIIVYQQLLLDILSLFILSYTHFILLFTKATFTPQQLKSQPQNSRNKCLFLSLLSTSSIQFL